MTLSADRKLLVEIGETCDPRQRAVLLFDYYHDFDRAQRTSREQMYLHLSMLTGMVMKLVDEQ